MFIAIRGRRGVIDRRALVLGAAGILVSGAAYAAWFEPHVRLSVTTYRPRPASWPAGFALRIAVLTDFHAGEPSMPLARVEAIVEVANRLSPDLILLLGDFTGTGHVWREETPWPVVARALTRLSAPLGVHAVAGNHEWWSDRAAQRRGGGPTEAHRAFADAGLPFLENTGVRLVHGGRPFWVLGLGDQLAIRRGRGRFTGADDLAATLAVRTDDSPALLLAHEPDAFTRTPRDVALVLSGHTHGGQVRLFGYSPIVPSMYGNRFAYGHVVEDGRHLIVSGGLGTVRAGLVPVRFGVPPEIVIVELGTV